MRSKFLIYTIFLFFTLLISIGVVIAVFTDVIDSVGSIILLSAIPLAAFILAAAKVNQTILIPRFVLQQRYVVYTVWCLIMAMIIPIAGLSMEYAIRSLWNFPYRIQNYLSIWIPVDSFSTSALMMVIFLGMGVRKLYQAWRKEASEEKAAAEEYAETIALFNKRIKASEILKSLRNIKTLAEYDAEQANRQLRYLSSTLRHELYDLPGFIAEDLNKPVSDIRLLEFFSETRHSWIRNACLILLIISISLTAIFDAPDRPNLTLDGLWAFLGLFLIIGLVTYGNISLCKLFLHKGKVKNYILGCVVFMCVMTVAMIVVESISYVHTIHNGSLPLPYTILATLSSFCTLTLYLCGITALVILNYWLRTEHRTILLKAETSKTELQFLQSQINPHFLFNVLNNIGILISEMPDKAAEMMVQLSEMFEYQMKITNAPVVYLSEEVDFLRNYLLLEQSRKSNFNFSLIVYEDLDGIKIPSLLLIPFVENASKHSTGNRDIKIEISIDSDNIIFQCSNIADKSAPQRGITGGLGIANTRRRLDLLYNSCYRLDFITTESVFKVLLIIPRNK